MDTGWTLDIKNMVWVEDTENQVEFIIKTMGLTGRERILDLACGYGRHALSFARRGYAVVGVDYTGAYIEDAKANAATFGSNAEFILMDVRDVPFSGEFDVVLNLADGAIGYFDTDEENLKLFDVIARALKPGGKHLMDICNAEHAEMYFPTKGWLAGEKELSLSEFTWNGETRKMCFSGYQLPYGKTTQKPEMGGGNPTRLYSTDEIDRILKARGMKIEATFSDYYGAAASPKHLQLMVYSRKLQA